MSGEVRLPMPTDLRHEPRANHLQLQSDEDTTSTHSSSWWKRGITNLTVETPTRPRFATNDLTGLQTARWRTPEFIVYAVVIAVALLLMVRVPMRLSDSELVHVIFALTR
jgi:membrane-bound O-acyltransferase GUP1_2